MDYYLYFKQFFSNNDPIKTASAAAVLMFVKPSVVCHCLPDLLLPAAFILLILNNIDYRRCDWNTSSH